MTMLSPAEIEARLRLHSLPQIGPLRFKRLLASFTSASAALSAPASAWTALGLPAVCAQARRTEPTRDATNRTLHWLEHSQHSVLFWDHPNYPALLGEISDAPPVLFVQGNSALLEQPQLAMVGSRRASISGIDNAKLFAASLARGGFVITSGLALGIDAAAHQGALMANGSTVAVVGTGLGHVYPKSHVKLAHQIIEQGGAIVSELPIDCTPQAANFPRRNRIISGLSLGVLVVEASLNSGSLITARLALEQGREVYAIPSSIHHPGAKGCHLLLKQGATLVEGLDDIMAGLSGWQVGNIQPNGLWATLLAAPYTSEALAAALHKPLPEVLAELTELELDGKAVCEAGVWIGRTP